MIELLILMSIVVITLIQWIFHKADQADRRMDISGLTDYQLGQRDAHNFNARVSSGITWVGLICLVILFFLIVAGVMQ